MWWGTKAVFTEGCIVDMMSKFEWMATGAVLWGCLGLMVAACSEQKPLSANETVTRQEVAKETEEALAAARKYAEQQQQEYREELERHLTDLDRDLGALEARAKTLTQEARTELEPQLKAFRDQQLALRQRLEALKSASGQAWVDMQAGADAALKELEQAYERAASRYR